MDECLRNQRKFLCFLRREFRYTLPPCLLRLLAFQNLYGPQACSSASPPSFSKRNGSPSMHIRKRLRGVLVYMGFLPKPYFRISFWLVLCFASNFRLIRGYFALGYFDFVNSLVSQAYMVPRYDYLSLLLGFPNLYGPQVCLSGNVCGGRGVRGLCEVRPEVCFRISLWVVVCGFFQAFVLLIRGYFALGCYDFLPRGFPNLYCPQVCFSGPSLVSQLIWPQDLFIVKRFGERRPV